MKRSPHSEHDTPKKRRKGRGPHTASPQPRNSVEKPVSLTDAKTSSDLFQKATQKIKRASGSEPPPAGAHSTLGSPIQVKADKQLPSGKAAPPSEKHESGTEDSNATDDIEFQKTLMKERIELARKRRQEEAAREEQARKERIKTLFDKISQAPGTDKAESKDGDEPESSREIVSGQVSAAIAPASEKGESTTPSKSDLLDDIGSQEKTMKERIDLAKKRRQEEPVPSATDRKELLQQKADPAEKKVVENNNGAETETVDLTSVVLPNTETPRMSNARSDNTNMNDLEIVEIQQPGSGSTADDAMDVDAYPSGQHGQQSHTNSQQPTERHSDKSTSMVSTEWFLDKLHGLSAADLETGRATIVQELKAMEDEVARLPRAEMHAASSHIAANNPTRRLLLIENLIGPDMLAKIPKRTWAGYKQRLLRLCAHPALANMDYRQRLEKIKEIVFLPEEMELLRYGNNERIGCAIRVCAAVTEITGRDDEIVPEEMAAWVDVQLQDVAWKSKVTSVWRKYWPDNENAMVVD